VTGLVKDKLLGYMWKILEMVSNKIRQRMRLVLTRCSQRLGVLREIKNIEQINIIHKPGEKFLG
jgi:hypothetical protein